MEDPLNQLQRHFTGLWLREEGQQGRVYGGYDSTGAEVTIAVLTGPAASDHGLRNAFADAVWQHSVGSVPGRATVHAADLHAPNPWAATRSLPDHTGAEKLLSAVADAAPTSPLTPLPPGLPQPPAPSPQPPGFGSPGGDWAGMTTPLPPTQDLQPASQRRGPWPWVIGATAVVVVVGLFATVGVLVVQRLGEEPPPVVLPTNGPPTQPAPTESPATPDPTESPSDGPTGEPELRQVDLVSVVGPNFDHDEDTWTMAFNNWPFAFRTPGDWNCLKGDFDRAPDAEVWTCAAPGGQQRANVLLWECEDNCSEDEQQDMNETWLDEPDQARAVFPNEPTVYVETEENDQGYYSVDLSHYAGLEPGDDTLRYLVGVYIQAPPDDREDAQKVLNDIVSQAG